MSYKVKKSLLPSGYTQVEYIQSDGQTQYIDTGIYSKDITSAEVKFNISNTNNFTGFGDTSIGTGSGYPASMWCENTGIKWYYQDGTTILLGQHDTDITATLPFSTQTAGSTVHIFHATGAVTNKCVTGKFYYVKLLNGSNIVFHGIPAKNSSNVLGMYDLVSKTFFTNAGTGAFTAGPEVSPAQALKKVKELYKKSPNLFDMHYDVAYSGSYPNIVTVAGGKSSEWISTSIFGQYFYFVWNVNALTASCVMGLVYSNDKNEILYRDGLVNSSVVPSTNTDYPAGGGNPYKINHTYNYVKFYVLNWSYTNRLAVYTTNITTFMPHIRYIGEMYQKNPNACQELPNEYQQVEYLEASGTQYIDTGENTSTDTELEGKIVLSEINNQMLWANNNTITNRISCYLSNTGACNFGDKTSSNNNLLAYLSTTTPSIIKENSDGIFIDGVKRVNFGGGTISAGDTMYIFTAKNTGASGLKGKMYYCIIKKNDTLVRYFIPCYRKSDSVAGMYDLAWDGSQYGSVDMGTLHWSYRSDIQRFEGLLNDKALGVTNIYSKDFITGNSYSDLVDKGICSSNSTYKIFIRDDIYGTDIAAFKSSLSGKILYYQRTTDTSWTSPFYTNSGTGTFTIGNDIPKVIHTFSAGWDKSLTSSVNKITTSTARAKNLKEYSIKGKTAQNGTPTPSVPLEVKGVGDKTENLYDGTITNFANAGTVGVNNNYRSITISVTAGETYTFKRMFLPPTASTNRCGYFFTKEYPYSGLAIFDAAALSETTMNFSITVPAECTYFTAYFDVGGVDISGTQMMFVKGTTVPTEYIPYGYEIPILSAGKNMIDIAESTMTASYTFKTLTTNEVAKWSGKTLTLSCYVDNIVSSVVSSWAVYAMTDQGNYIGNWLQSAGGRTSVTFNLPSNSTNVRFVCNRAGSSVTSGHIYNIQLEESSTATDYEPYVTPVVNKFYLSSPLQGISTYTDELKKSTGKITRNVGIKVLDGTENWQSYTYQSSYYSYYIIIDNMFDTSSSTPSNNFLNTHFEYVSTIWGSDSIGYAVSSMKRMFFRRNTTDTIDTWKSWLAQQYASGNPVIVYYPLATTTEESISNLPTISTVKGTNIISTETEVTPTELGITYVAKNNN